ncbi:MAG: HHL1-like protein [Cyanobacteria bacterium P01_A01_bin.123]
MSTGLGFGPKKTKAKPKTSKGSLERASAAKQYEQLTSNGTPDYEIYIRIRAAKHWYPVGVVAVKRSGEINRAIYSSLEQLHEGAFRLYPILRKNQHQLEYGYRLKEFKDDPIQLATPPATVSGNGLQNAIAGVKGSITGLFKR